MILNLKSLLSESEKRNDDLRLKCDQLNMILNRTKKSKMECDTYIADLERMVCGASVDRDHMDFLSPATMSPYEESESKVDDSHSDTLHDLTRTVSDTSNSTSALRTAVGFQMILESGSMIKTDDETVASQSGMFLMAIAQRDARITHLEQQLDLLMGGMIDSPIEGGSDEIDKILIATKTRATTSKRKNDSRHRSRPSTEFQSRIETILGTLKTTQGSDHEPVNPPALSAQERDSIEMMAAPVSQLKDRGREREMEGDLDLNVPSLSAMSASEGYSSVLANLRNAIAKRNEIISTNSNSSGHSRHSSRSANVLSGLDNEQYVHQLDEYKSRVSTLEGQIEDNKTELSAIHGQLQKYLGKNKELNKKLLERENEVASLRAENANFHNQMEVLSQSRRESTADIATSNTIRTLVDEKNDYYRRYLDAQEQVDSLQGVVTQRREQAEMLTQVEGHVGKLSLRFDHIIHSRSATLVQDLVQDVREFLVEMCRLGFVRSVPDTPFHLKVDPNDRGDLTFDAMTPSSAADSGVRDFKDSNTPDDFHEEVDFSRVPSKFNGMNGSNGVSSKPALLELHPRGDMVGVPESETASLGIFSDRGALGNVSRPGSFFEEQTDYFTRHNNNNARGTGRQHNYDSNPEYENESVDVDVISPRDSSRKSRRHAYPQTNRGVRTPPTMDAIAEVSMSPRPRNRSRDEHEHQPGSVQSRDRLGAGAAAAAAARQRFPHGVTPPPEIGDIAIPGATNGSRSDRDGSQRRGSQAELRPQNSIGNSSGRSGRSGRSNRSGRSGRSQREDGSTSRSHSRRRRDRVPAMVPMSAPGSRRASPGARAVRQGDEPVYSNGGYASSNGYRSHSISVPYDGDVDQTNRLELAYQAAAHRMERGDSLPALPPIPRDMPPVDDTDHYDDQPPPTRQDSYPDSDFPGLEHDPTRHLVDMGLLSHSLSLPQLYSRTVLGGPKSNIISPRRRSRRHHRGEVNQRHRVHATDRDRAATLERHRMSKSKRAQRKISPSNSRTHVTTRGASHSHSPDGERSHPTTPSSGRSGRSGQSQQTVSQHSVSSQPQPQLSRGNLKGLVPPDRMRANKSSPPDVSVSVQNSNSPAPQIYRKGKGKSKVKMSRSIVPPILGISNNELTPQPFHEYRDDGLDLYHSSSRSILKSRSSSPDRQLRRISQNESDEEVYGLEAYNSPMYHDHMEDVVEINDDETVTSATMTDGDGDGYNGNPFSLEESHGSMSSARYDLLFRHQQSPARARPIRRGSASFI